MVENIKLEGFKKNIKGKKVGIIGVGVSNIPAMKYLLELGAIVTAMDKRTNLLEEYSELKDLDVKYILGENYLEDLTAFDIIFRSPRSKTFFREYRKSKKNRGTDYVRNRTSNGVMPL